MKNKPKLIASAKPRQHKVQVGDKTFVYSHVRKQDFSEAWHFIARMRRIASITLAKVKEICQNGSNLY